MIVGITALGGEAGLELGIKILRRKLLYNAFPPRQPGINSRQSLIPQIFEKRKFLRFNASGQLFDINSTSSAPPARSFFNASSGIALVFVGVDSVPIA